MTLSETDYPRVILVVPYGELTLLPGVVNSAVALADRGYVVDIVAVASDRFGDIPKHEFFNEKISVHYYQPSWFAQLPVLGWHTRNRGLVRSVLRVAGSKPIRCLFGVDADGLIAAAKAGVRLGVPVFYYSLELELASGEWKLFIDALRKRHSKLLVLVRRFLKNRLTTWFKKPRERQAHRLAQLTIALDEQRARALLEDNRHPKAEVVIVPTSPPALQHEPDTEYLRRKYNLSQNGTILLQVGGISDVALSLELAKAVNDWPDDWTLILHGFASDEGYLREVMTHADGRRIIVSTDMVPYATLDDLIASADIGLAFYKPIDLNYLHMASGKLLNYLKCGLPVVAIDFPNLRQILEGNGCGICVPDEKSIVVAASRILEDRSVWSANAQKSFEEKYEFNRSFEGVLKRLDTL